LDQKLKLIFGACGEALRDKGNGQGQRLSTDVLLGNGSRNRSIAGSVVSVARIPAVEP
jgi:hypothetical protein